ncbi:MAG: ribosomal protein [Bacteroidota bacterium]|jgi:large subunit ribosomal protein L30
MAEITVKQVRSVIGRPKDQKDTIKSLGLRRMNHSVTKTVTPQILGMIKKVAHLLEVSEVSA